LEKALKQQKPKQKKKAKSKKAKISKHASQDGVIAAPSLHTSIVAQAAPFRVQKSVASILSNAKPSQKLSARSINSISIASGSFALINVCPCIASDSSRLSAGVIVVPLASATAATSTITSTTVGVAPAGCTTYTLVTNTPYTQATLEGGDYAWRLVSNGIRLRNITPDLYKGGVIRHLVDYEGVLLDYTVAETTTFGAINDSINYNQNTVRSVISGRTNDVEIAVHSTDPSWRSFETGGADNVLWGNPIRGSTRFGGTTALGTCCISGTWVVIENYTGQTQMYDMELVEHWEIHGSAISQLMTPSPSSHAAYDAVRSLVSHAHTQHSSTPHLTFAQVVKGAVKMEHNKAAMDDVAALAPALALL